MKNSKKNMKIERLFDVFVLDNKLLYACDDFIGFNPAISKGLSYMKMKGTGTKINTHEFEMLGESFNAILTFSKYFGPLRGYHKVEILRNGTTIIMHKVGGILGGCFSKGNKFLIKDGNAYLLINGFPKIGIETDGYWSALSGDDHYLLGFNDIIVPTKYEIISENNSLPEKEFYLRKEIEPLRQKEWDANFRFNDQDIIIIKTSVPGFTQTYWNKKGFGKFIQEKDSTALDKTEIIIDGKNYYFDE